MSFFDLLNSDPEFGKHLSKVELEGIFDYGHFLRHVDDIFKRLGL
jgi:adenylosuccinate lyase